jgi:hypothetical protein
MPAQDISVNIARLEAVSKEVPPASPGCRAWAALYPFVDSGEDDSERTVLIRVRVVDVPLRELDFRGGDLDGDEPFIHDRLNEVVRTPEEVAQVLARAGISCEGFGSSYQSGLPF